MPVTTLLFPPRLVFAKSKNFSNGFSNLGSLNLVAVAAQSVRYDIAHSTRNTVSGKIHSHKSRKPKHSGFERPDLEANKKSRHEAGFFEFKWMGGDQYFATTGPPNV
jgi:hypothetical protein